MFMQIYVIVNLVKETWSLNENLLHIQLNVITMLCSYILYFILYYIFIVTLYYFIYFIILHFIFIFRGFELSRKRIKIRNLIITHR